MVFTLINGRMCSQRNCPVCLVKAIVCLSSCKLLAENRFWGSMRFTFLEHEREALLNCFLWNASHVQIIQLERVGGFLYLHDQPVVVELWRSVTGRDGVFLVFLLQRILISHFSLAFWPSTGSCMLVCKIGNYKLACVNQIWLKLNHSLSIAALIVGIFCSNLS